MYQKCSYSRIRNTLFKYIYIYTFKTNHPFAGYKILSVLNANVRLKSFKMYGIGF